ncbi:MAG: hypothetical protein QM679_01625 [Patulibacter sp.]
MDDSLPEAAADPARPLTAGQRLHQVGLVLGMFFGSIAMWAGAPALWLWLAAQFSKVSASGMKQYLMVIVGIPVTMVLIGKLLTRLDNRYTDHFGSRSETNFAAARWLRSVRGGGEFEPPTMLDKVLVVAVGLAFVAAGVWFAFFSGGSQAVKH